MARMRQIQAESMTKIRPILTPDQRKKMDAMIAEMHSRSKQIMAPSGRLAHPK